MKHLFLVLFIIILSVNKIISAERVTIERNDFIYNFYYNDSLKRKMDNFTVWYVPESYNDIVKKGSRVSMKYVKISHQSLKEFTANVEKLMTNIFTKEKLFNKEGKANIYDISYHLHLSSGKVYLTSISFTKDAYQLISDDDILRFIKEFNGNVKMIIDNKDEVDKNAYRIYYRLYLFSD